MPFDNRRFNGPDKSVSYKIYTKDYKKSKEDLYKELFDENGLRRDGRAFDEARSLFAKVQTISQAKGSSYLELKRTKVVCSVYGPKNIPHHNDYKPLGELHVEFKFAPFSCSRQRRQYSFDEEEKLLSAALKKALEPAVCRQTFPNSQCNIHIVTKLTNDIEQRCIEGNLTKLIPQKGQEMQIFVLIMEHDGACFPAAVIAAGLALADAVVPMYDTITASSVAVINNQIFVDPTEAEEYLALLPINDVANHGVVTMSMLHELKQVADMRQIGAMDANCFSNIMDILEKECIKTVPLIQSILVKNVVDNCERKNEEETEHMESVEVLKDKFEEWKKAINPST